MPKYRISQVAEMVGVSVSTLLRWERAGDIPLAPRFRNWRNGERQYSEELVLAIRARREQLAEAVPNSLSARKQGK